MTIFLKVHKPDNFESQNFVKLNFIKILDILSNFIEYGSFLESSSPGILALCEANLNDSTDSGNFSVQDYLPLIRKGSGNDMQFM